MNITEYKVVEFKGVRSDGKAPWHFFVIKLGENESGQDLYYSGYRQYRGLNKLVTDVGFAMKIATEKYALEDIGFIQNFFDKEGNPRPENVDKTIPPLAGVAEAAEMLGWQKQQVTEYMKRGKFPEPLQRLASGPIWTYKQIEDYRDSKKINDKGDEQNV